MGWGGGIIIDADIAGFFGTLDHAATRYRSHALHARSETQRPPSESLTSKSRMPNRARPDPLGPWESNPLGRPKHQRYGLLVKPPLVRFRVLDERLRIQGLDDISTPVAAFAELELPVRRVFITENETNGLVFPAAEASVIIFGLGYGIARLARVPWLRDKTIYYWGDLDTHGFAILDSLRAALPEARSFLRDRETLLGHRGLWVEEPEPIRNHLWRLG